MTTSDRETWHGPSTQPLSPAPHEPQSADGAGGARLGHDGVDAPMTVSQLHSAGGNQQVVQLERAQEQGGSGGAEQTPGTAPGELVKRVAEALHAELQACKELFDSHTHITPKGRFLGEIGTGGVHNHVTGAETELATLALNVRLTLASVHGATRRHWHMTRHRETGDQGTTDEVYWVEPQRFLPTGDEFLGKPVEGLLPAWRLVSKTEESLTSLLDHLQEWSDDMDWEHIHGIEEPERDTSDPPTLVFPLDLGAARSAAKA